MKPAPLFLESVGDVLSLVLAENNIVLPKACQSDRFELDVNTSESRSSRAAAARVRGGIGSIHGGEVSSGGEIIQVGFYRYDVVKEPVSIRGFMNRPGRPRIERSANLDEIIDFIKKFPDVARAHTIVCLNSGMFGQGDDVFPRLIAFRHYVEEAQKKKPRQEGFEAARLDRIERFLLPGELIISKLPAS